MKHMTLALFGLLFFSITSPTSAHAAGAYISVGKAKVKKTILAVAPIQWDGVERPREDWKEIIKETITRDLTFMDYFRFLPESEFKEGSGAGMLPSTFKFADWSSVGAEFVLKSTLSTDKGAVRLDAYFYDPVKGVQLFAKRYVASTDHIATIGHYLSNDIIEGLTGTPGIFLTRIAMSCDRTKKKEIYMMDFDGSNVKQITRHGSIAFAPSWSPDGTRLAYSLFTKHANNQRNIDLFEFNFSNNTIRLLSNRTGINSGAFYAPDGKSLILTMSFLGNPEIFSLDTVKRSVKRLTRSYGFDVDPSWSPNGKRITFASSRSGKPMIYSMNADGSDLKRLTFAGRYNATPSWSPSNNKIAFASWIDEGFDIFLMNPDGTKLERLTKDQGSNEDPQFSHDGNFLVFSSDRTGSKNVYVMNIDGTFVKRLTYGLGNCVTPRWSAPPLKLGYVKATEL